MAVNSKDAESAVETFLKAVGVDMEEQNMRRTPARVADFWWKAADAAPEGSLAGRALRLHAAHWYRAALADGTLAGLAGKLAERRVREARDLGPADWAEAAARAGPGPA